MRAIRQRSGAKLACMGRRVAGLVWRGVLAPGRAQGWLGQGVCTSGIKSPSLPSPRSRSSLGSCAWAVPSCC